VPFARLKSECCHAARRTSFGCIRNEAAQSSPVRGICQLLCGVHVLDIRLLTHSIDSLDVRTRYPHSQLEDIIPVLLEDR